MVVDMTIGIFKQIGMLIRRLGAFRRALKNSYSVRGKITGVDIESLISLWLAVNMPDGYYIVLTDINHADRDMYFWSKIPKDTVKRFIYNDVVVLSVKDTREADRIMDSISPSFAKASFFKNEKFIDSNCL